MGKKRTVAIILIFVVIFAIALCVMGYMVMSRIRTIDNEALKIARMDINTDKIDETIYSSGKYAVVEATMKNYVSTYIDTVREFASIDSDERLLAMLGSSNLQEDGPAFVASKAYIEQKRQEIAKLQSTLAKLGTEQNVLSAFSSKGMNFFFNWVYQRTMLNTLTMDFFYDPEAIQNAADTMNATLDKKEAVLNFLSENSSGWQFGNNMIEFTDEKLLEDYTKLVSEI